MAFYAVASTLAPVQSDGEVTAKLEGFRFVEGKQLERLKNGQSVAYDFSLQLLEGPRLAGRSLERFVVSYDLWEENFSVVQLPMAGLRTPKATATRLKLEALGPWCLSRVKVPWRGEDRGKAMSLLLEVRSQGAKIPNPLRPEGGIDLTTMVEIFSRPAGSQEYRFTLRSQAFMLGAQARP